MIFAEGKNVIKSRLAHFREMASIIFRKEESHAEK